MSSLCLLLVAGGLPALISGLPVSSTLSGIVDGVKYTRFPEKRETAASYSVFGGSGTTSDGWPAISDWISAFATMFEANQGILSSSCTQWGVPNNSADEISDISTAIQSVASSSGVDPRFILAIVMQESNGCVRAPTTNYGVRNPGLMQSHNGAGTCNDASVSSPCPASEITQMITDGTSGTSSGDGLKQCLAESGSSDVSIYYKAARIYNSGSIDPSGNLGAGIATHCYASDIANRLIGWASGPSACSPADVGSLSTSEPFAAGSSGPNVPVVPTTTSTPVVVPATTSPASTSIPGGAFVQNTPDSEPSTTSTTTSISSPPVMTALVIPLPKTTSTAPEPPLTTTPAFQPPKLAHAIADSSVVPTPSAPVYPGATTRCQEWYTVQAGDYCDLVDQKFGISLDQLIGWNSGLDFLCSNLWLGYQYCVKG